MTRMDLVSRLRLLIRKIDREEDSLHIPADFPRVEPTEFLLDTLKRIRRRFVIKNERSTSYTVSAIIAEAIELSHSDLKILTEEPLEAEFHFTTGNVILSGKADYMIVDDNQDSRLVVVESGRDWPEKVVFQTLAEAACLMRKRFAENKFTPVFAILTNSEFYRFFALDIDNTVYASRKRYFDLYTLNIESDNNLREILTWLVWIFTSINSRRSSETDIRSAHFLPIDKRSSFH